jgi:hypothetical protein
MKVRYTIFERRNYVQQRKTYTRKTATVHLNCPTVPCNTLCARIAAAVFRKTSFVTECDVCDEWDAVRVRWCKMQYPRVRHIHVNKLCNVASCSIYANAIVYRVPSLKRDQLTWSATPSIVRISNLYYTECLFIAGLHPPATGTYLDPYESVQQFLNLYLELELATYLWGAGVSLDYPGF